MSDSLDLDDLLTLETSYQTEGYNLGVADGSRAGRIEGRIFGLEKGFEKYSELSRLNGRGAVWKARIAPSAPAGNEIHPGGGPSQVRSVKALESGGRLQRHIHRLCDLTDPSTLPTENSEDAVSEFDDRLKDARTKATLISKIVGEAGWVDGQVAEVERQRSSGKGKGEMEDFVIQNFPGAAKRSGS